MITTKMLGLSGCGELRKLAFDQDFCNALADCMLAAFLFALSANGSVG